MRPVYDSVRELRFDGGRVRKLKCRLRTQIASTPTHDEARTGTRYATPCVGGMRWGSGRSSSTLRLPRAACAGRHRDALRNRTCVCHGKKTVSPSVRWTRSFRARVRVRARSVLAVVHQAPIPRCGPSVALAYPDAYPCAAGIGFFQRSVPICVRRPSRTSHCRVRQGTIVQPG